MRQGCKATLVEIYNTDSVAHFHQVSASGLPNRLHLPTNQRERDDRSSKIHAS
jgi:hypothetical protein